MRAAGCCVLLLLLIGSCSALYSPSDDVYDLTSDNFQKMVLDSHFVWIIEFYAPWYAMQLASLVADPTARSPSGRVWLPALYSHLYFDDDVSHLMRFMNW